VTSALWLLSLAAVAVSSLRWLRVGQREHYLPGSVSEFAWRWWTLNLINTFLLALVILGLVVVFMDGEDLIVIGLGVAFIMVIAPRGLGVKGSTSPLIWTDRLRRVAIFTAILWLAVAVSGAMWHSGVMLVALVVLPILMDLALWVLAPVERRLNGKWVNEAHAKLASIDPTVVAITGSYGKTTTKGLVAALASPHLTVVASPASFNNRMGLARAINEHLALDTDVFIAEMGTYGPGEIRDLCSWIPPKIAVITAIGPVHLERFGSLDVTVAAKAEIFEHAEVAVVNIDDERLAALVPDLGQDSIITCSAEGADATVSLSPSESGFFVRLRGEVISEIGAVAMPSNLACAIGVAAALEVPLDRLSSIISETQAPAHRQDVFLGEGGFHIIDDTYNSNPAGVRSALSALAGLGEGRRVVVTPGMVELGSAQFRENKEFGRMAAEVASDVLVVGHTNRKALLEGTKDGAASVIVMLSRPEAVAWVKANLGVGDAVLYENDLPDHYA